MDLDLITVSAKTSNKQTIDQVGNRICVVGPDNKHVYADDDISQTVCTSEKKIFTGEYYWKVLHAKCGKKGASIYVPNRNDQQYFHGADGYAVVEDIFIVQGKQDKLRATFSPITPAKESIFLRTLWNTPDGGTIMTDFGPAWLLYVIFFAPVVLLSSRVLIPPTVEGPAPQTPPEKKRKFMLAICIPALVIMFSIGAWWSSAGILLVMITDAMISFKETNAPSAGEPMRAWMLTTLIAALGLSIVFNFMHALFAFLVLVSANGEYTLMFTPYLVDVVDKNAAIPGVVSMDLSPAWSLFMLLPSIVIAIGFLAINAIDLMWAWQRRTTLLTAEWQKVNTEDPSVMTTRAFAGYDPRGRHW